MMIRWLSGEFFLDCRPNGGNVIVLRALWVAGLAYVLTIIVSEVMHPNVMMAFSGKALEAALLEKLPIAATVFAASYTAFYARFASQWSYLAGVYNQIMAAKVRGTPQDELAVSALNAWQAGFIEDAEELHLATKPIFAGVILSMLGDEGEENPIRSKFVESTADGKERLRILELRVRAAYSAAEERRIKLRLAHRGRLTGLRPAAQTPMLRSTTEDSPAHHGG